MQCHYRKTSNLCYLNFYNFQGFEVIKWQNRGLLILLIFMLGLKTRNTLIRALTLCYYFLVKKNLIYDFDRPT